MSELVVNDQTLVLSGSISRQEASRLRDAFLVAMSRPEKPAQLCLSQVENIDSAGVQILCALLKGFPHLRISDASQAVRVVLAKLGVPGMLGGV